jgi:HlyD family secretion protein
VDKIFPQGTSEDNVIYFPVRIVVTQSHPDLRPGMTADVSIVTAEKSDILLVPDTAIDHTGDTETVLVVTQADERPERREVEIGVTDYERTEIISGAREGERLLLPDAVSGSAAGPGGEREAGPPPGPMMRG